MEVMDLLKTNIWKYNRDFIYNSQFQKIIKKYNYIFFDLDHTLFNEYEFLSKKYFSFFSKHKLAYKRKNEIILFVMKQIVYGKRNKLIQKVNKYFYEDFSISLFLKNLRSKDDIKIYLFRGVKIFLNKLIKNDHKIFLYTSGNLRQQKNKVELLQLNQFFIKNIVYAHGKLKKPNPLLMENFIIKRSLEKSKILFIGDSKEDIQLCKNSRIKFKNINTIFPKIV